MFNNLYRVMVKGNGKNNFQGTGQTKDGEITIESNVINQMFYTEKDANILAESLIDAGFETKIVQGSRV